MRPCAKEDRGTEVEKTLLSEKRISRTKISPTFTTKKEMFQTRQGDALHAAFHLLEELRANKQIARILSAEGITFHELERHLQWLEENGFVGFDNPNIPRARLASVENALENKLLQVKEVIAEHLGERNRFVAKIDQVLERS